MNPLASYVPILVLLTASLHAGEDAPLPPGWADGLAPGENAGLAAKYANDAGLAQDPDVWHVEDFESGKVVWPYKEGNKLADLMQVTDQNPHLGAFCGVRVWKEGDNGGAARYWLPKAAHQGANPCYFLRAYRKFDRNWHPGDVKKKVGLKGMGLCCLKAKFDGRGGTVSGGTCDGTDWYTAEDQFVGWDGNKPGAQDGYYWFGHCYSYMPFPKEAVAVVGENKLNDPPTTRFSTYAKEYLYIQYEKWYCFEIGLYLNTPGQRDGEMRYWIDGVLQARVTKLCFRTIEDAWPEVATLNLYRTTENFPQPMTLWMDDIVVARRYIGPAKAAPAPPPAPPRPAAPPKPPEPAAPAIDPAPHRAALAEGLAAAAGKATPPLALKILGKQETVKVLAPGKDGATVEFKGNKLPLRWKDFDDEGLARIAQALAPADAEALFHAAVLAAASKADALYAELALALRKLDAAKAGELEALLKPKP